MLERIPAKKTVVGVLSVAHGTYWHQFPGLREKWTVITGTLSGFWRMMA